MVFGEGDLKGLFILWMWAGVIRVMVWDVSLCFIRVAWLCSLPLAVQMCLITATLAVLTEASACSAFKSHQMNIKFLVRRPHFYVACACIPAYALHVHDRIHKVASFKKSHQRGAECRLAVTANPFLSDHRCRLNRFLKHAG